MQLNRYYHYHYYEHFSYVLRRLCYKILLFFKTMMMPMIYVMKAASYALVPSPLLSSLFSLSFLWRVDTVNSAIFWWRWVEREEYDDVKRVHVEDDASAPFFMFYNITMLNFLFSPVLVFHDPYINDITQYAHNNTK